MYKFKTMAKRGGALAGAVGLLAGIGTSALPAFASADALNPLVERSLLLSSSSPGWSYLDGSGNSTYAPPNSGANGQKTGNFFSFRTTSVNPTIKGFTFQYCTVAAGNCMAPGDDTFLTGPPITRHADTTTTTDLNVVASSPGEISGGDWSTIQARHSGVTPGEYAQTPLADNSEGNFVLIINGTVDAGWTMTTGNNETGTVATSDATGRNNIITLTNSTGSVIPANAAVEVKFFATDTNYITNPGSGAFFVRINDYSLDTDVDPVTSTHVVDGGVTVANVMNESISIQTKVLETMAFSVGVKDPDVYNDSVLTARGIPAHGQCSSLLMADPLASGITNQATYDAQPHNVLKLGDSTAEFSLKTGTAYDVNSYWRLSSNSSGGATVYYTGHTLTNTEGDAITPLGDSGSGTSSITGTEQFGLGIAQNGPSGYAVNGDTYGTAGTSGDYADFVDKGPTNTSGNPVDAYAHSPRLAPLVPATAYGGGAGTITSGGTAKFSFNSDADSDPVPIASENTDVVNCVTAKMRYIANIAATTPAGVYTTKVNYVAAPQY